MKNLSPRLMQEYEYYSGQISDIPEIKPPLINISDTLKAYFILADYFTDESSDNVESMLIGVRDVGLLSSAISRQIVTFGNKAKYTDHIDICATLFYGLVKNHSFSDGNKRTALLILLYQLSMFGYVPDAQQKEFEKLVVAVAANTLDSQYEHIFNKVKKSDDPLVATISKVLRRNVKKKDHTYHIRPTMKEFCDALEKQGVKCEVNGTKLHFETSVKKGIFKKKECYSVSFSGWTRTVGAGVARSVLENMHLYNQYASYADFMDGKEPMYQIVNEYSGPLRRLKDK